MATYTVILREHGVDIYLQTIAELPIQVSTRNILDCDQSNYSSRIILAHIPAKLLS